MADVPPAKKVVRRVVKKAPTEPTIRYGRPAEPPAPRVATKRAAPPSNAATKTETQPGSERSRRVNPVVHARAAKNNLSHGLNSSKAGLRSARSGIASLSRKVADESQEKFWSAVYAVKDWWLPQLRPINAAAVTGLLAGLLAVALGCAALVIFSWLRGVASGGGTWGSLTFVVVAFVAFACGEWLLGQFGVASARLTSLLGVIITIIAILGLFLGLADSTWAVVVVPLAASVSFALSNWLMAMAESSTPESDA